MPAKWDAAAFARAVQQLPDQITNNVARGAARAFMEPVKAEAQRLCRDQEVSYSLKITTKVEVGAVVATIGTTGKGAYKAPWLEKGTKPHLIAVDERDRGGKSVGRINRLVREGSLVIGGKFVGPVVEHPGARAFPFLRPALDSQLEAGSAAAAAYIAKRFNAGDLSTPAPADEGDQ